MPHFRIPAFDNCHSEEPYFCSCDISYASSWLPKVWATDTKDGAHQDRRSGDKVADSTSPRYDTQRTNDSKLILGVE